MSSASSSLWDRVKNYAANVGVCYLSFAIPVAVFFAFNSAADTLSRDPEKFGALWIHYNRLEPEERERVFPTERVSGSSSAAADLLV